MDLYEAIEIICKDYCKYPDIESGNKLADICDKCPMNKCEDLRWAERKDGEQMEYCEWAVREGWGNSYWGSTPCKKGFNYLSKTNRVSQLKDCYENRLCPICGKPIKLKGYVFDDDFVEQW